MIKLKFYKDKEGRDPNVKMTLIYPPFGKMDFVEDNSIPGMHVIVKRKDNE